MGLQLIDHCDPRQFCDVVTPALMQFESQNCVQIGLVLRMAEKEYVPISAVELDRPLLLTVQNNDRVELVAVQTHKAKMLVTHGSDQAMRCLGDELAHRRWTGEEIFGFSPSIGVLAEHYARQSGRRGRLTRRLGTFQLTEVAWPTSMPGSMRLCGPSDRHVLAQFLTAFEAEIGEPSNEDILVRTDRMIEGQRIFFWVDPRPVAMAGWAGRTPNGIRINAVYTPPEFRGRGYASNLVAHLSQRQLDEGRKFCFLNTDKANPTSNSIYQKIGYVPVCDAESWEYGEVDDA